MQFKRVLPISDHPVAHKKLSYSNRTPALIQKQQVKEFECSGLRQVDFCEQHNIPYKTFSNWLRHYRSDQVSKKAISLTQEHRIITTSEDTIKKGEAATTMICTLPNSLSITLNLLTLDNLPNIIEKLSTCKLN